MRTADPELHRRRCAEIAAAAARAFLAKGFHGTSMQDVAREAGVSMGLLYRYYADKAALIAAAASVDRQAQLIALRGLAGADDPAAELLRLTREALEEARTPGYVDLVAEVAAEACRNPAVAAVLIEDDRETRRALADALRAQQVAGRLRPDVDPDGFAEAWTTLVDGLMLRARLDPATDPARALSALAATLAALRPDELVAAVPPIVNM
ncbi:MAG: TetR family transcriptional regulator [Polyangiaceae bacterium]|jgi:AcrR family transcriptional regulator|nr:TetR family transcriptional regulator [Polyangiaceae bacterium]